MQVILIHLREQEKFPLKVFCCCWLHLPWKLYCDEFDIEVPHIDYFFLDCSIEDREDNPKLYLSGLNQEDNPNKLYYLLQLKRSIYISQREEKQRSDDDLLDDRNLYYRHG